MLDFVLTEQTEKKRFGQGVFGLMWPRLTLIQSKVAIHKNLTRLAGVAVRVLTSNL